MWGAYSDKRKNYHFLRQKNTILGLVTSLVVRSYWGSGGEVGPPATESQVLITRDTVVMGRILFLCTLNEYMLGFSPGCLLGIPFPVLLLNSVQLCVVFLRARNCELTLGCSTLGTWTQADFPTHPKLQ